MVILMKKFHLQDNPGDIQYMFRKGIHSHYYVKDKREKVKPNYDCCNLCLFHVGESSNL